MAKLLVVIPGRLGRPLLLIVIISAALGTGNWRLPPAAHAAAAATATNSSSSATAAADSLSTPPSTGIDRPPPIVSDLPTTGPPTVLPSGLETGIELHPNNVAIELGPRQQRDAPQGIGPAPVLDEGEPARGLAESVQPHVDGLDGPDGAKGRAEVTGAGGEGQVADVQGRAALEGGNLRVGRVVVRPVPVQLGLGGVGEEEVGGGGRWGEDVSGRSSGGGCCGGGGVDVGGVHRCSEINIE